MDSSSIPSESQVENLWKYYSGINNTSIRTNHRYIMSRDISLIGKNNVTTQNLTIWTYLYW